MRQRYGMKSPRERGRPARTTLARPRPTPRPGSTGNGARTLLRPGLCLSHGQGGRVPNPRETERHRTGVHAGGTPALPGGASSNRSCSSRGRRRLAGLQPCRCGRAVPLRGPSSSFVDNSFFVCFRRPGATRLFCQDSDRRSHFKRRHPLAVTPGIKLRARQSQAKRSPFRE